MQHAYEKAVYCEFHDHDERILEHIIQTSDNSELIREVLHKKWTLQQTLAEMQVLEDTSMHVEVMGHQNYNSVSMINRKTTYKRPNKAAEQNNTRAKSCRYCGRSHPMKKRTMSFNCEFCNKCGKSNQFTQYAYQVQTKAKEQVKDPHANQREM